jgi:Protein of unknown function (DUF2948)
MPLKLIAMDADDLTVISAHLQDARLRRADMTYLPREKRFAFVCFRQDHINNSGERLCGLHFDRVTKAERLQLSASGADLTFIGIGFETRDTPSGLVTLLFDGGAAVRLTVECIEAVMNDQLPADTQDKR